MSGSHKNKCTTRFLSPTIPLSLEPQMILKDSRPLPLLPAAVAPPASLLLLLFPLLLPMAGVAAVAQRQQQLQ